MELRQQLGKWNEQAEAAGEEAEADFEVAKRLLKHGISALDEIERLRGTLRMIESQAVLIGVNECSRLAKDALAPNVIAKRPGKARDDL